MEFIYSIFLSMLKFDQECQNFVYKTHFVRIMHLQFHKLALAVLHYLCVFLSHRLPLGGAKGCGCQGRFPVPCTSECLGAAKTWIFWARELLAGVAGTSLCTAGC